jgi:hypothetical protein
MKTVTMLQFSYFKTFVILPILSLLTVFILPIRMYWFSHLRARYMYSRVKSLQECTDLLVHGRDGNIEVVTLQNLTDKLMIYSTPEQAQLL